MEIYSYLRALVGIVRLPFASLRNSIIFFVGRSFSRIIKHGVAILENGRHLFADELDNLKSYFVNHNVFTTELNIYYHIF